MGIGRLLMAGPRQERKEGGEASKFLCPDCAGEGGKKRREKEGIESQTYLSTRCFVAIIPS